MEGILHKASKQSDKVSDGKSRETLGRAKERGGGGAGGQNVPKSKSREDGPLETIFGDPLEMGLRVSPE